MLALDHRSSFRKLISPENPDAVGGGQAIELKKEIIAAVYDQLSGLLIDPEYGLPAYNEINPYDTLKKPFLLSAEETGYEDVGGERVTKIKYNVQTLKDLGASGVKLLIYFNPSAKSAQTQIQTAKKILRDAHEQGLPFFLEVLYYGKEPDATQNVKILLDNEVRPDIFKLGYPGSSRACKEIARTLEGIPWVLLSEGVNFEEFCAHLEIASKAGCRGFLAGRSLWQEAIQTEVDDQRKTFLNEILSARFERISKITGTVAINNTPA